MVEPSVWGPPFWSTIHYVALAYPKTPSSLQQEQYRAFFLGLGDVLPCYKCRQNFKRHVTEIPLDDALGSNDELFAWTVALHNAVNRDADKPPMDVDYARAKYLGTKTDAPACTSEWVAKQTRNKRILVTVLLIFAGLLLLILVLLLVYKYFGGRRARG